MSTQAPLKIYIVDDDAEIVDFMTVVLKAAGHEVFSDISAAFAIPRISAKRPDCLITDLIMAELDGLELCQHLRERKELRDLIIVFVSAQGSDFWKQRSREAGADGYIVKPLEAASFGQQVEQIVADARNGKQAPKAEDDGALPGRR